ncbi:MAG: sigma-54 dependent transcriptional regulator [bacterium]
MHRILVMDDDESFRKILEYNLRQAGYEVVSARSGQEGLAWMDREPFGVVITDIKMPGMDGLEVLREVKRRSPDTPVIMVTAFGSIEMAVDAMKQGAADYITKPLNRHGLLLTLEKTLRLRNLREENLRLREELGERFQTDRMVGVSAAMRSLLEKVRRLTEVDATVLITGETGAGKDLIARGLHYGSRRREQPFVAVNCTAIPRELLESELFGHVKGAFTGATRDRKGRFQAADGGTLFLDEVGSMDPALQGKLLRVLQDQRVSRVGEEKAFKVDVRILAATNTDLRAAVDAGGFREDLYYRLNVVPLHVPSLRERIEDIPLLIDHFLGSLQPGSKIRVDPRVLEAFRRYEWPGNVRELRNVIERMLIFRAGDTLGPESLPPEIVGTRPAKAGEQEPLVRLPAEGVSLEHLERTVIAQALEMNGWNQVRTARFLRIPRHILLYRMEKYGIRIPEGKGRQGTPDPSSSAG